MYINSFIVYSFIHPHIFPKASKNNKYIDRILLEDILTAMNKFDLIDNQEFIDINGDPYITNNAIVQGATYQITFVYEGDVTLAIPRGQIRTKYAQDENILLATFSFLPMTYDIVANKTTITAELSAVQTASIPYTKYSGVGVPSIRNCHVYDLELAFPDGVVKKLAPVAFVQVVPEATV